MITINNKTYHVSQFRSFVAPDLTKPVPFSGEGVKAVYHGAGFTKNSRAGDNVPELTEQVYVAELSGLPGFYVDLFESGE